MLSYFRLHIENRLMLPRTRQPKATMIHGTVNSLPLSSECSKSLSGCRAVGLRLNAIFGFVTVWYHRAFVARSVYCRGTPTERLRINAPRTENRRLGDDTDSTLKIYPDKIWHRVVWASCLSVLPRVLYRRRGGESCGEAEQSGAIG